MADGIKGQMSEGGLRFVILIVLVLIGILITIKFLAPILKRMLEPLLSFLPT
ncbi:MAG: hypothetical protein GOU99_00855 [Candidatus Altiarchaeota archaeon]|nr:hypothetical protein [Candidatus Altiarchaeota archaeon]